MLVDRKEYEKLKKILKKIKNKHKNLCKLDELKVNVIYYIIIKSCKKLIKIETEPQRPLTNLIVSPPYGDVF